MITEPEYNLLVSLRDKPAPKCDISDKVTFELLHRSRLIIPIFSTSPYKFKPTPEGIKSILLFEQIRDEKASQKAKERSEKKISILSAIMPFICFILGLVVEHFSNIISLLFH